PPGQSQPGQSQAAPSEPHRMPGTATAPSATPSREPGPPASAARPAERTIGGQPPGEARESTPRAPERTGTRPPEPSAGSAAQRPPAAPESTGHGTSGP